MADLQRDIAALRQPTAIKKVELASSPYILRKILAADPIIQRLIAGGEKVIPLIAEEVRGTERLDEITLAAFAFIVESVDARAAPRIFEAQYRKSVEEPGPFFVYFAAHAIRSGMRLPIKPLEMAYSHAELVETQQRLN